MNPFQFSPDDSASWEADRPRVRWFPRDRNWKWPDDCRALVSLFFLISTLGSFASVALAVLHPRSHTLLQSVLIGPIFNSAMVAMCGTALWAIWQDKSWARRWAAAASSFYFVEFLRQFLVPVRPAWDHYISSLFVGILGLVSFSWRGQQVHHAYSGQTIVTPVQIERYTRKLGLTYHHRYSPAIWACSFVVAIVTCVSIGLSPRDYAKFIFVELVITYLLGFVANGLVGVLIAPRNQAPGEAFHSAGSLQLNHKSETDKKSNS